MAHFKKQSREMTAVHVPQVPRSQQMNSGPTTNPRPHRKPPPWKVITLTLNMSPHIMKTDIVGQGGSN